MHVSYLACSVFSSGSMEIDNICKWNSQVTLTILPSRNKSINNGGICLVHSVNQFTVSDHTSGNLIYLEKLEFELLYLWFTRLSNLMLRGYKQLSGEPY